MDAYLCDAVYLNLLYQQLWNDVKVIEFENQKVVCGVPSHKLSNDDETISTEYVYPVLMKQYQSSQFKVRHLKDIFNKLPSAVRRITLAIVSDDGTIVYYFIYKGLQKPKKN